MKTNLGPKGTIKMLVGGAGGAYLLPWLGMRCLSRCQRATSSLDSRAAEKGTLRACWLHNGAVHLLR